MDWNSGFFDLVLNNNGYPILRLLIRVWQDLGFRVNQDSRRLIYLNERLREKALEKKPKICDILKAIASFQQSISEKPSDQ
ncbi:hypothetical protein HanIR_Chr09g0399741 [Helianthus annuus]|nr:hypothetical protein HanIR_Chr09g0399741 [Helianthus annuus]